MLTDAQRSHIAKITRTLQIILAGLASGVIMFGVIAVLLATREAAPQNGAAKTLLLTYIAAAFAFVSLAVAWVLPSAIAGSQLRSLVIGTAGRAGANGSPSSPVADLSKVGALANMFQTRAIIGASILEGAALLNLIAYLIEQQPLSLMMAGMLVACMLSQFPTIRKMGRWIESELKTIEQLRQLESAHGR
jgi:hypothetical protein